jgi:hypothetical protein
LATRQTTFSNDGDESTTDHADVLDKTDLPLVFTTARELRDAANADACGATGCTRADHLRPVTTPDGRARVLCRYHEKHALGVTS